LRCYLEYLDSESQLLCQSAAISDATIHTPTACVPLPIVVADEPFGISQGWSGGLIDAFPQGMLFAYVVATVLSCAGLWIASVVSVSKPDWVAVKTDVASTRDSDSRSAMPQASPKAVSVGRITATVDCLWDGSQKSEIKNQKSAVVIGDSFNIRSGLLEITYDTGARVVLQGPTTFAVDSTDGGYLTVGKLTARLENGSEARGAGDGKTVASRSANPLFAIRTPTAIVTDLGTEFGVLVDKDKNVEVQVFRGLVDMQRQDLGKGISSKSMRLSAGQGVRITRHAPEVAKLKADVLRFPAIPSSPGAGLVAYYPFDSVVDGLTQWAPDSSSYRRSLALQGMSKDDLQPGKSGNAMAFNVIASKGMQCGTIPWSPAFDFENQSFTIAMWLNRRAAGVEKHEIILAKELFSPSFSAGYAVVRDRKSGKLIFRVKGNGDPDWNAWIPTGTPDGQDDAPIDRWVHFAVVGRLAASTGLYDIQLYRDGVPVAAKGNVRWSVAQVPLRFCAQEDGWAFRGLLDDVRFYSRALSGDEVKCLYANPGSSPMVNAADNGGENK
jgi:hypothetical protein